VRLEEPAWVRLARSSSVGEAGEEFEGE